MLLTGKYVAQDSVDGSLTLSEHNNLIDGVNSPVWNRLAFTATNYLMVNVVHKNTFSGPLQAHLSLLSRMKSEAELNFLEET